MRPSLGRTLALLAIFSILGSIGGLAYLATQTTLLETMRVEKLGQAVGSLLAMQKRRTPADILARRETAAQRALAQDDAAPKWSLNGWRVAEVDADGTLGAKVSTAQLQAAIAAAFAPPFQGPRWRLDGNFTFDTTLELFSASGGGESALPLAKPTQLLARNDGLLVAGRIRTAAADADWAAAHPGSTVVGVLRLGSDGSIDTTYLSNSLRALLPIVGDPPDPSSSQPLLIEAVDAGARVFGPRGVAQLDSAGRGSTTAIGRLDAYGQRYDARIVPLPEGGAIVYGEWWSGAFGRPTWRLLRFDADGRPDAPFDDRRTSRLEGPVKVLPTPSGDLLVIAVAPSGPAGKSAAIYRMNQDGAIDRSFNLKLPLEELTTTPTLELAKDARLLIPLARKTEGRDEVHLMLVGADGTELTDFRRQADAAFDNRACPVELARPVGDGGWLLGVRCRSGESLDDLRLVRLDEHGALAPNAPGDSELTRGQWNGPYFVDGHAYMWTTAPAPLEDR